VETVTGSWLYRLTQEVNARLRLVCFPHAGGAAAAFRLWPAGLPPRTEVLAVQYPGRGSRLDDPPVDRIFALAQAVGQALLQRPALPTVFFGHSMGGLVAFEVARQLADRAPELPRHLIVSGHAPPHRHTGHVPISHLPDAEFLRELDRRYAAVPAELLQYPDVLALLLPALRADIAAVEHCGESPAGRLSCPITAFGGSDDPNATELDLGAWRELTHARVDLRVFPGGHFFINTQREPVLAAVSSVLRAVAGELTVSGAACHEA
jgi:medium-chain acyl-[acyl-carrier-protein] hydrolase